MPRRRRETKERKKKTLYLCRYTHPLKVKISKTTIENFLEVQEALRECHHLKRYWLSAERSFGDWAVRITRHWIDLGSYVYEGWKNLTDFISLEKLPDVFFSTKFLLYARKSTRRKEFREVIESRDLKYFFSKLLEGDKPERIN